MQARVRRTAALAATFAVSAFVLLLAPAPASATTGSITEYPVSVQPIEIAAGPDGALWFTYHAIVPSRINR